MQRLFHVNTRKLSAMYFKRILLMNIPTAAAMISLVVIVNLVMRGANVPLELYRAVFYSLHFFVAYSFIISFVSSIVCGKLIEANKKYTYVEIFTDSIVVSQHEKSVRLEDNRSEEYVRFWIIRLSDVEDVYSDKGYLFIKGKARFFCMPERFLHYTKDYSGKVAFEHPWNNDFGGEYVQLVKFKDYYTLGERILRRVLQCAEKSRITEQRRAEFRERMLKIAKQIDKKSRKELAPKYKPPVVRGPREGIKKRNW